MDMMEYYRFFVDIWKFFRKYYPRAGTEQDYGDCTEELTALTKRHGESTFVLKMSCLVLDEVDRIWRERTNETKL